jgi:hypothetical protein
MKQKAYFTSLLFFWTVLQRLITAIQLQNVVENIQLDLILFLILITILSVLFLVAIIFFCKSIDRWVLSDFKLNKLWPIIISGIAILSIYYTIKTIINTKIKRVQNRIQSIPNALIRRNTAII